MYQLEVTTAADEYPVNLDEAKAHLRVEGEEEDALIDGLIAAATVQAETVYTWRAFVTRQYTLTALASSARRISGRVWLPMPPVQSVESVTVDGVATGEYTLFPTMGMLELASGVSAASTLVVEYTAGYGDATTVPAPIKQAILLLVGHWYENREAVVLATQPAKVPLGVESLLLPYRAWRPG